MGEITTNETDTQRLRALSVEELKRQADSLIQSVGAFQFTLARIAYLEGFRERLMELLAETRTHIKDAGLCKRIDTLLKESDDSEPTL